MCKCYMCDADSVTREHVPPKSFFPTGYRDELITVPSCTTHNNDNSLDVEYVRNIILAHYDANGIALKHFADKAKRSYDRSPALLARTTQDSIPVEVDGQQTGIIQTDITRFTTIFEAIAYALHYHDFGTTFPGKWHIYFSSMMRSQYFLNGQIDEPNRSLHAMLESAPFIAGPTSQPDIFQYASWQQDNHVVYKVTLYGGFGRHYGDAAT